MITSDQNPEFLNDFLAYISTILNKSNSTVKEYNYDIAHFLKFIKYKYGLTTIKSEEEIKQINISDFSIETVKQISLEDIHAFLAYLKENRQHWQEKLLVLELSLHICVIKPNVFQITLHKIWKVQSWINVFQNI